VKAILYKKAACKVDRRRWCIRSRVIRYYPTWTIKRGYMLIRQFPIELSLIYREPSRHILRGFAMGENSEKMKVKNILSNVYFMLSIPMPKYLFPASF